MTAKLVTSAEPGSPEWHDARTQGIGGSEIAAIVGLSPYESAFSLWHRKTGNLHAKEVGDHVQWGNRLEGIVADHFAANHPEFIVAPAGTYQRGWQIANPDRLLHPDGDPFPGNQPTALLEVKTSRFGDGFGKSIDAIPLHYRCQITHYMDVLDLRTAWVAVLIGGNEYREYRVDYDAGDAAALRDAGEAFWQSVQSDQEPPIDASFETYAAVRDLHPDIDGTEQPINEALFHRYMTAKVDAESADQAHRQAKSELLHAIGNARYATVNDRPVLRRQPGRNGSVSLYEVKTA